MDAIIQSVLFGLFIFKILLPAIFIILSNIGLQGHQGCILKIKQLPILMYNKHARKDLLLKLFLHYTTNNESDTSVDYYSVTV